MNKKLLFFLILILLPTALIDLFLPKEKFSFRAWESLLVRQQNEILQGPFYPNQRISRIEVGDLAAYTKDAVPKTVSWRTDAQGFRNDPQGCQDKDVLVIGDSTAAGSSLSQEDTFSNQLSIQTNTCVYNFGGSDFNQALAFVQKWNLKPKFVFLVIIERFLPDQALYSEFTVQRYLSRYKWADHLRSPMVLNGAKKYDEFKSNPFHGFKAKHGLLPMLQQTFGYGIPAYIKNSVPEMVFFTRKNSLDATDSIDFVTNAATSFLSYKNILENKFKAPLIVVVVPEKESIYWPLLHLNKSPSQLPQLYKELRKQNIKYLNLFQPFEAGYLKAGTLYHHLDDTHWNKLGVEYAVNMVLQQKLCCSIEPSSR